MKQEEKHSALLSNEEMPPGISLLVLVFVEHVL